MVKIRSDGNFIGRVNNPSSAIASGIWSLKDVERSNRNLSWPQPSAEGDPYFNLNTLLVHADGSNNANNVVYADSSTNAYTVTRSGSVFQGTFSPFSQTGWSNYFNGTDSQLTVPNNSYFEISTPFTAECWVYPLNFTDIYGIMGYHSINTGAGSGGWVLYIGNSSGMLSFNTYNNNGVAGTTTFNTGGDVLTLDSWNHVAVSYDGSSYYLFINGLLSAQIGSIGAISYTGATFNIGRWNYAAANRRFPGYISNVRFVSSALYTNTFTPSTSPLTAVTNTRLLTCHTYAFKDDSTNDFSVTPAGTVRVEAFAPFAPSVDYSAATIGGSNYFVGSSSYLTLPSNMTALGNDAYTLEGWFYPINAASVEIPLLKLYNTTGPQVLEFRIVSNSIEARINAGSTVVGGDSVIYPYTWYHFALVKASAGSSTTTLYINGKAEITTATDTTTYNAFPTPRIGANQTPTLYYSGYASSVRLIKGSAVYTSNFTPPSEPFTNTVDTIFLLNFTNAGIIDNSTKINMTTLGTAALATSTSRFGSGSMYFDGTGSYIQTVPGTNFSFGTGDFTIEAWIYNTSSGATAKTIFGNWASSAAQAYQLFLRTNNRITWQIFNQAAPDVAALDVPINEWVHIAWCRSGSNCYLFINGILKNTATGTNSANGNATYPTIGSQNATNLFFGYIDELRITKGVARYTADFPAPTLPFSNR